MKNVTKGRKFCLSFSEQIRLVFGQWDSTVLRPLRVVLNHFQII